MLVETLATGTPVISADCEYGPREILANDDSDKELDGFKVVDYGILPPAFKEGNDNQSEKAQILADAIIKVFSDEELITRMKTVGTERAKEFSTENYRKNILEPLEKVDSL